MVITDHLIIFLQLLTVRMCACIRTDRTCTHRTICTIMVTTQALLSCSSSNSSMNSTQSTSTIIYAYYSLSFGNFGAAAAAPVLYRVAQFPVRRPVPSVRHVHRASPAPPERPVRPERTSAPHRMSRPFHIVIHDVVVLQVGKKNTALSCRPRAVATGSWKPAASPASRTVVV